MGTRGIGYAARWCCALLLGALPAGCSRDPAPVQRAPRDPLLLFAVDGLDWSVLLPLVQSGRAPHFRALMERGSFGELRSLIPTSSPVIWTTVATGKTPRKHGIVDFVYGEVNDGVQELHVYNSGHRRTKAFWNILSDSDRTVDVIGWWITYPAERVDGLLVSQTNTTAALHATEGPVLLKGSLQSGVERQVWPPEREAEVLAILAQVERELPQVLLEAYGTPPHPPGPLEQALWDESRWAFRADETYLRILERRLDQPPADLTAVYLGETDVVGHRFWRYAYPEQFANPPDARQIENFGGLLEASYLRADRALGAILARLPERATVLVVSDHGMHADNVDGTFHDDAVREERLSGKHLDAPPGVFIAAGPHIEGGRLDDAQLAQLTPADLPRVGSVLDVLPTLLVLLEVPLGADMDGSPMLELFDPGWLLAHPPARIPTHDTPEWLREHEALRVESRDLDERLEQLRALGYVR